MPELPEVETVRRGIELHLPRKRLRHVELRRPDLRFPIPTEAIYALTGRRCQAVRRRAKYLLLDFDGAGRPSALIHLGMSGRLTVDSQPRNAPPPEWLPHEHWRMDFGSRLARYVDPRRFGVLDATQAETESDHALLRNLGPEPLGSGFTAPYLVARTRRKRTATKIAIMDPRLVVGVGNIYASEACFLAGIRPGRAAGRLTHRDCGALVDAVQHVLAQAIEAGGTTLRDHVGVDGNAGYFEQQLAVYGRRSEPCRTCQEPIQHKVLGGRATYYCRQCQT